MEKGLFDFCAIYYTTQLVRCAFFSFLLLWAVLLLRKKLGGLRGLSWALLLAVPFLGRLRMFYEDTWIRKWTWWMSYGAAVFVWLDYLYIAGILAAAAWIFGKRLNLWRKVTGMEKMMYGKIPLCITDMNVTPFTAGLFKPKIVLPRIMVDSYSREELDIIILHERTHIRLGHLWFGFLWDIFRCLYWVNPLLTIFQKYFRADMEDICDRVCIQNSGKTAQSYGRVLIKTLKLLRCTEAIPVTAAYAGEKDFDEIKRRILEITKFRPYSKKRSIVIAAGTFMAIATLLLWIRDCSYAHYNESNDIMVCKYDGEPSIVSTDTEYLSKMISYDKNYVYVKKEAFEQFLHKNNAAGDIYIVFGGFYKLPGLGGAAEGCMYEGGSTENGTVRIAYKSIMDNWLLILYMLL